MSDHTITVSTDQANVLIAALASLRREQREAVRRDGPVADEIVYGPNLSARCNALITNIMYVTGADGSLFAASDADPFAQVNAKHAADMAEFDAVRAEADQLRRSNG